jgi:glycosyltransferase involved in cell wall biosynthesis
VSQTLSVVIPTKNAAELLAGALESVKWADELIVVDMFSTDETDEVCARYPNCRLFKRDDYIFGNVNFGFDQATTDWVMRLDTDERITPELAAEIRSILAAPPNGITGYAFAELTYRLGKRLRHGFGRPHYRRMMFRRGAARYPVREEHESFETSGEWLRTRHGYEHFNYATVGAYLQKMDYYTERDAERADLPAQRPAASSGVKETARAFYLYYLKWRGYRDGWIGLLDAAMRSFYQFVYWAKLRERWERERGELGDA